MPDTTCGICGHRWRWTDMAGRKCPKCSGITRKCEDCLVGYWVGTGAADEEVHFIEADASSRDLVTVKFSFCPICGHRIK